MTTDDKTPMLKAAVEAISQAIRQALDGPSVATGRPPRASAGASLVSVLEAALGSTPDTGSTDEPA